MIAMETQDNENLANAVTSDDEDPLEDDEAKLRSIHFLKRDNSSIEDDGGEKVTASVKRYDEMGSFLSRSERSLHMPDHPPSDEDLAKRQVNIKEQPDKILDVEPMSEEESKAYYMGDEDFRRVDIDVELTTMRWEKAQKNKGKKFDDDENPTRGLEEMLDTKKIRSNLRKKHRAAVLEEMVRQKTSGNKKLDWEKIREAAEPYSKETSRIAYEIALQDAGKPVPKKGKSNESKKKKGGLFGIFKKK